MTAAQAQAVMDTVGLQTDDGFKGLSTRSGYYRTMSDIKKFELPWPSIYVYKNNGKKASYDSLSLPEFLIGYLCIIVDLLHAGVPQSRSWITSPTCQVSCQIRKVVSGR